MPPRPVKTPIAQPPAASFPAWVLPALIAAAAILLIGVFSREVTDPDTWWHLKTGQYIVQ